MRRRFWNWVHDGLWRACHWVYRTKLHVVLPGERYFMIGSSEMGTLYWSKSPSDPEKLPEMNPVDVNYYRVNPDGSYTLLDGFTDSAVPR